MEGYLNFTQSDIINILITGGAFFMFSFASIFAYYISGTKKIQNGQANMAEVVAKGIIIHVMSILFIWVILSLFDFAGKVNNLATSSVKETVIAFFYVDWTQVNLVSLVKHYNAEGKNIEPIALLVILKIIWIVLTFVIILFPVIVSLYILAQVFAKHKTDGRVSSAVGQVVVDMMLTFIVIVLLFTIHIGMPFSFLSSMFSGAEMRSSLDNKIGSAPKIELSYKDRAGALIKGSLHTLKNHVQKQIDEAPTGNSARSVVDDMCAMYPTSVGCVRAFTSN